MQKPEKTLTGSHLEQTSRFNYCYVVLFLALVYTVALSIFSIIRFESFTASAYDLGIMIQTVWNTANGWMLQESINMGFPMLRFWMAHWEFIYVIIAFFYIIFSSPHTILIFQTAMVASGAIPIFWLGRQVFQNSFIGIVFAAGYLLNPAIHNANLFDVHGITLAAPMLAFSFYYLYNKNYKRFIIFSALALSCREDSALILIMMGIYAVLIQKEKKVGFTTIVMSALFFLLWYKRMTIRNMLGLPAFDIMAGADTHWSHLSQVGEDILYPIKFLAKKYNIRYFLYLFGPVIFTSFFSLETLLIATPVFAINLLSSYFYTHDIEHYYSAPIVPFIYISAIIGSRRILDFLDKKITKSRTTSNNKILQSVLVSGILVCSGMLFLWKSNVFDGGEWKIIPHFANIKKVIRQIPEDASVSSLNALVPHVAERHEVYVFNDNIDKVDYILYDFYMKKYTFITRETFLLPFDWPDNKRIETVLRDRNYGCVAFLDGVCLFRKGANYDAGLMKLAYSSGDTIHVKSNLDLTPEIQFVGHRWFEPLERGFNMSDITKQYFLKMIHFTTFWSSKVDYPEDYKFYYKIYNTEQSYFFEHYPVFELFPTSKWIEGELVRDEIFWEAPRDLLAGKYTVAVALEKLNSEISETTEFQPLFEFEF